VKLVVNRFVYEPPGLAIIPETDFEAAMLSKYWESAVLSKGRACSESKSVDGWSYGIKLQPELRAAGGNKRAEAKEEA
jgi:hypothetical protein